MTGVLPSGASADVTVFKNESYYVCEYDKADMCDKLLGHTRGFCVGDPPSGKRSEFESLGLKKDKEGFCVCGPVRNQPESYKSLCGPSPMGGSALPSRSEDDALAPHRFPRPRRGHPPSPNVAIN